LVNIKIDNSIARLFFQLDFSSFKCLEGDAEVLPT